MASTMRWMIGDLCAHAFRHGRPLGLVGLVGFMSQGRPGLVKDHRQTLRLVFTDDLHQRGRETVDGVSLQALGIIQRGQGKKGAIDIGAPVDQVQGRPARDVACAALDS